MTTLSKRPLPASLLSKENPSSKSFSFTEEKENDLFIACIVSSSKLTQDSPGALPRVDSDFSFPSDFWSRIYAAVWREVLNSLGKRLGFPP